MNLSRKTVCPICEETFELEENLEVGDTTYCPCCYGQLKIVKLNPIELEEEANSADEYGDEDSDEDGDEEDSYE